MPVKPPSPPGLVPFIYPQNMMELVLDTGVERIPASLADYIEEDFRRWELFDKKPPIATHCPEGVIELMPGSDGVTQGFKYANGHPRNIRDGHQPAFQQWHSESSLRSPTLEAGISPLMVNTPLTKKICDRPYNLVRLPKLLTTA